MRQGNRLDPKRCRNLLDILINRFKAYHVDQQRTSIINEKITLRHPLDMLNLSCGIEIALKISILPKSKKFKQIRSSVQIVKLRDHAIHRISHNREPIAATESPAPNFFPHQLGRQML